MMVNAEEKAGVEEAVEARLAASVHRMCYPVLARPILLAYAMPSFPCPRLCY